MLTEYACHDESFMTALGSHNKALSWAIEGGGRSTPVKIGLQMEKTMMGKAEIMVTEGDRMLFPIGAGQAKASLSEDLIHRWNFCGLPVGLNEPQFYEALVSPAEAAADAEDSCPVPPAWHPATVTKLLEGGSSFEVLVTMIDDSGASTEVLRSPVNCADLRERHTKKRIHVPWRYIKLQIPRANPLQAALTSDKGEPIANFFGMPTPAGPDAIALSTLTIRADRERSSVHVNTSAAALAQFVIREAFRGEVRADRSHKAWTLHLGPFAEHAVTLEKGSQMGMLRLSVDGRRLAEASAQDLGCEGGTWECEFRFHGKNILDFVVFETNRYGMPLDVQGTVTQESRVEHTCSVLVPSTFDLSSAHLRVEGLDFERLPTKPPAADGKSHTAPLEMLRQEYGISVPYKVNDSHLPKEEPIAPPVYVPEPSPSQPAAPAQPDAAKFPETPRQKSWAHWFGELQGIWHACSAHLRVPSEEELNCENDVVPCRSRSSAATGQGSVPPTAYDLAYDAPMQDHPSFYANGGDSSSHPRRGDNAPYHQHGHHDLSAAHHSDPHAAHGKYAPHGSQHGNSAPSGLYSDQISSGAYNSWNALNGQFSSSAPQNDSGTHAQNGDQRSYDAYSHPEVEESSIYMAMPGGSAAARGDNSYRSHHGSQSAPGHDFYATRAIGDYGQPMQSSGPQTGHTDRRSHVASGCSHAAKYGYPSSGYPMQGGA